MGPTEAAIDGLEGLVYRRRRVILGLGHAYTLANHMSPEQYVARLLAWSGP